MAGVHVALEAADDLAADGIEAEVIDLRTLRPLDHATVAASLSKTSRLLVLEEGARTGGWSATVAAELAESSLHDIDDIWRVTTADLPIPFSPSLEDAFLPAAGTLAANVRARLGGVAS